MTCAAPRDAAREVRRGSPKARGYDAAWQRLSARARRLQPWCSDCGATDQQAVLTGEHSAESWAKRARGERLTVVDVEVLCRSCNSRRGAKRSRARQDPGG